MHTLRIWGLSCLLLLMGFVSLPAHSSYFQSESREDFEELFSSGIFTDIRGAANEALFIFN